MSIFSIIVDFLIGIMFFFYGYRALAKGSLGESTDRKLEEKYTSESVITYKRLYGIMMFVLGLGFIVLGVLGLLGYFKVLDISFWAITGVGGGILVLAIVTLVIQYAICKKKD